ncbi:hypothetical protein Bpfe_008503 [Biomphalaria pfeifferi]|uniref:IgGFc-binding protein N-terminal domain-containing protein n=1 Tax=Biomphalaria pfeifferi TaxID=112525 RepID=A0AAD8BY74_BIOPF|nr:hypothetical protein Bpfe_008503 [Biomphalaria pfeifferi]
MISACIGLVLCLLPPGTFSIKVNVTALGNEFLLAFPRLRDPNIYLLIYTLAENITVRISLTNPGSSNHSWLGEFSVLKLKSVQYRLDKDQAPTPSKEYSHHKCLLLTSDQPFGVHVHMYDGSRSLSSFMAVPIRAFGRAYVVITHKTRSFFTVVAERKTKMYASLVINPSHDLVVEGAVRPVGAHNWRTVELDSYQAFSLTKCFENRFLTKISLTGSIIESNHPIGVISGSCSLNDNECRMPEMSVTYSDMAAEMLLPEKMLGLNFVIAFCRKTSSFDYIIIATSQPDTLLLIYHNQSADPNKLHFPTKGTQNVTLRVPETYVTSTYPVALYYYYVTTSCQGSGDKGGPSIMTLVPNELFYNLYAWVNPPAVDVVNFISLVLPVNTNVDNVRWNNGSIPYVNMTVNEVWVHSRYFLVTVEMWPDSGEAVLEAPFNFGCYFSGLGYGSFFQAAGFIYNDEKFECYVSVNDPDDGRDNDCDGLVDEEYVNLLDDDGDGLIDEDTYQISALDKADKDRQNDSSAQLKTTREPSDKMKLPPENSSFLTWTVLLLILISAVSGILEILFISPKALSARDEPGLVVTGEVVTGVVVTEKQMNNGENDLPADTEATGDLPSQERTSVLRLSLESIFRNSFTSDSGV